MPGAPDSGAKGRAWTLWFWVILAFVLLIGAWAFLITVAVKEQPDVIEIHKP